MSQRSVSSARVVPSTDTRAASVAASASASEPVDALAATSRRSAASPWSCGDQLHGLPRREVGHLDVATRRLQVRRARQLRAGRARCGWPRRAGRRAVGSRRRPGRTRRGRRSPRRARRPGAPARWTAPRRGASSCVSTTSRPLAVSRPNAVGSSTTRSPVAVPADPVGPSVVAATGAAPDPAGRPSSASASGRGRRSQHQDPRRGARPLLAQRGHGAVDHGRVLGEPRGRHGAGHDGVLAAPHPQRRHRHPRGGRAGARPGRSASTCQPAPDRTRSYSSRATRSPRSRSSTR